jgi:hypothetical protein
MTNTYTADEFLKKLNAGALQTPLICEGFAKPIDDSREAFLFSPGVSCEEWIKIPAEIVEKVEFIGEHSCREHSHPLVQIHFKEAPANEPFAAVFSSILHSSNSERRRVTEFEPINPQLFMKRQAPWIGEWLTRVIADAGWYAGRTGGGEGASPGLGRLCYEAKRKCRRLYPYQNISEKKRKKACEQMSDFC